MDNPENLKYTKEHEWLNIDGSIITIGITDYAQDSLGDIVFVELPKEGVEVAKGETFGVVESVKAVSDLYSPVTGKVVEVNDDIMEAPEVINDDPYGDAWMIKVEVTDSNDLDETLDSAEYGEFVEEES